MGNTSPILLFVVGIVQQFLNITGDVMSDVTDGDSQININFEEHQQKNITQCENYIMKSQRKLKTEKTNVFRTK